jgi:hypothetical protein
MLYTQVYPRWTRFWCKVFLTEAVEYFAGAASKCMLDNSSIIIAHGTGKDAVPAADMAALATHFGFTFAAHAVGDADRSARVERPFDYIDGNFYVGRTFADVADLNGQLRTWCDKVNATYKRSLRAAPRDLFAVESPVLKRLPAYVHPPTEVHHRIVDSQGYVTLHTNTYSVPAALLDHALDVLATKDRIRVHQGHRLVCEHERREDGAGQRSLLPEHREERRALRSPKSPPSHQETTLCRLAPELAELVAGLKRRHPGRAVRPLRRLHQMYLDYPTPVLCEAIRHALHHGLYDLSRIESIVLGRLSGSFFRDLTLPAPIPDLPLTPHDDFEPLTPEPEPEPEPEPDSFHLDPTAQDDDDDPEDPTS